ncbi:MAG TPA: Bax inhibitor-1/YccA family protein [Actinoplanes sp.]|nr:Bax inhibitor-1/YccA family protein [Actinoplanes sp.]
MQSNNPVFRNSDAFNGRSTNAYGNQVYGGSGTTYQGYGTSTAPDPSTWSVGKPGAPGTQAPTGPMTIDSVVQKTAVSLIVILVAAFATWVLTPALGSRESTLSPEAVGQLSAAMAVGGLGAFALSLINSFKRVISPALVLAFCALQGIALGAFSKFFDYQYGGGIVIQAVIGTFAAFAGTLAAYKFFDIRVSHKFRMGVIAAVFGMVGLSLLQLVVGVFGGDLGFYGLTPLGFVFSLVGLVLGIFMLILDFDFVENGIRAGLPERESWRAAFGLAVSLVWIYTNLLRILAIMRR